MFFSAKYHINFHPDPNLDLASMLIDFFNSYAESGINLPIYVLIDNYDAFSYQDPFHRKEENHVSKQDYRTLFGLLKKAQEYGYVARMFVSGITPICNDFQSNGVPFDFCGISFMNRFSGIVGFTEKDIAALVKDFFANIKENRLSPEDVTDTIVSQLDGYCFSPDSNARILNTHAVIQCISYLESNIQTPVTNFRNTKIYQMLFQIREEYGLMLSQIDHELTNKGHYVFNEEFNTGAITAAQKLTELLYFSGILTIKGLSFAENRNPVVNFRLANPYITEIWQDVVNPPHSTQSAMFGKQP